MPRASPSLLSACLPWRPQARRSRKPANRPAPRDAAATARRETDNQPTSQEEEQKEANQPTIRTARRKELILRRTHPVCNE